MNHTDTIELFRKCKTCSRTFSRLLNREFGHLLEDEERATDPMAGGLMNQGRQCGMLWGAALAAGAEAYRRYEDPDEAMAAAVTAVQHILQSFEDRTGTINCKDIIGLDISKMAGLLRFVIRTTLQGVDNNPCYRLAGEWAPEVLEAAREGLSPEQQHQVLHVKNCAAQVVREMGGTEEEQVMVSGFAGGLGLSGSACGAAAAAIWMTTLEWCRGHPGKNPPYFNNRPAKKIYRNFRKISGGKLDCHAICGIKFHDLEEHSRYIENGGCADLISELAR
jgi:hypothetical protein